MIGLYAQNENTLKQLASLLKDSDVEVFHNGVHYDALLWLSQDPAPVNIPLIPVDSLPLTLKQWQQLIRSHKISHVQFQNDFFMFDASARMLLDIKAHKSIPLTEKETAFLSFLVQSPTHSATKELLLQSVWQYSPEAETHTLETHFYALRQKIGTQADRLIYLKEGVFYLI